MSGTSEPATRPPAGDPDLARAALERNPELWYHTIDLAPGVSTPGYIDLRGVAGKVLPAEMAGMRVLEIGTFDGFWSFEMERRGAAVTTVDLPRIEAADWPPLSRPRLERQTAENGFQLGYGFELAKRALGSQVERLECDIYELTPERAGAGYDLVLIGAILTHLRDPISALLNVQSVLGDGGELRIFEPISAHLSLRVHGRPVAEFKAASTDYTWWLPNTAALISWLAAARFREVRRYAIERPPCEERTFYAAVRGTATGG